MLLCKCGCRNELMGNQKIWYSKICFDRYRRAKERDMRDNSPRVCQCGRDTCQRIIEGKINKKYATNECYTYVRYHVKYVPSVTKREKPKDIYASRDGEKIRQINDNYANILASPGAGYAEIQKRKTLEEYAIKR